MMTSAQCRMARVALKWGVRELAGRAKVSTSTITRLEAGAALKERTVDSVRLALEAAGVAFTYGAEPGVRLGARQWPMVRATRSRRSRENAAARPPAGMAADVERRRTAVTLAGSAVRTRCHVCAFFGNRDEEYSVLLPFTKEGLEGNDRAVHLLNGRGRRERLRRLRHGGIDAKTAEREGRLALWRWEDAYLRRGRFDQSVMLEVVEEIVQAGRRHGSRTTRIWANMEWALAEFSDMRRLIEYESRLNHVLPDYDMAVVCAYDLRKFSASDVTDVLRAHPYVVLGGILSRNPFYVPPEGLLPELRARGGGPEHRA